MKPLTILLLLKATPAWLRLSRSDRRSFYEATLSPILQSFAGQLQLKFYDSEYFNSRVSDFVILETDNLPAYQLFMERLRDTDVYRLPYFEVVEIIPGQENAYQQFDTLIQ